MASIGPAGFVAAVEWPTFLILVPMPLACQAAMITVRRICVRLGPSRDGLKVGRHQASSASMVSLMTAPFFGVLRPQDRVAVKLHASPVFHATQYLMGRQTPDKMERFRAFGGMVQD